jgi:hypothetical protein
MCCKAKSPEELTKEQLAAVVTVIQRALWFDDGKWDPDLPIFPETAHEIADLLADYGLKPEPCEEDYPELTAHVVRTYIATGGTMCPFCKQPLAESGLSRLRPEGQDAFRGAHCAHCGRKWTDFFTLRGIMEGEDPNDD